MYVPTKIILNIVNIITKENTMENLPFGIAILVLAVLSVVMPFFFGDKEPKHHGYTPEIDEETGDFKF